MDWLGEPREVLLAGLDAQQHRRILKTHTPLDGVPIDPRVTYIVVARHPLDMAISLYHHRFNLDRDRMRELIGPGGPAAAGADRPPGVARRPGSGPRTIRASTPTRCRA